MYANQFQLLNTAQESWKNSLKYRKCLINVAQKNSYQKLVPNTSENNRLMTSNTTSDNYTSFDFNSPRYLQLININQKK